MLIDLHCHTRPLSACSSLTVDEVALAALQAGLDAVCLTEHDRLWPLDELRGASARHGILLLRGMEVTTEAGHVLVFGLEAPPPGMFLLDALAGAVRAAGGFMALAHPARAGQPAVTRARIAALCDAVEALNGSDGAAQNEAAAGIATAAPLPPIAGSDAHAPAELASVATWLERSVATEAELVAELQRGHHRVVDLRARRPAG